MAARVARSLGFKQGAHKPVALLYAETLALKHLGPAVPQVVYAVSQKAKKKGI
jgi:hypothetical protein